jgi:hypothetical protein
MKAPLKKELKKKFKEQEKKFWLLLKSADSGYQCYS